MSRELILKMSVSVDGSVGGPNGEMDWFFPSMSEGGRQRLVEMFDQVGLHAMGHKTYLCMASFWPISTLPIARPMNEIPKAVFSRSGEISAPSLKDSGIDPAALDSSRLTWSRCFVWSPIRLSSGVGFRNSAGLRIRST